MIGLKGLADFAGQLKAELDGFHNLMREMIRELREIKLLLTEIREELRAVKGDVRKQFIDGY